MSLDDDDGKSALELLAEVLLAHGVEFVVVGGQAEVLLGSPRVTYDVIYATGARRPTSNASPPPCGNWTSDSAGRRRLCPS